MSTEIIWEKKNINDAENLTWYLLVEYSYRLKLKYPEMTIEEFYDKFNTNFFTKIERPSSCDCDEELDFDMGYYDDINDSCAFFNLFSKEQHDKYYKMLLDRGIEF